MADSARSDDRTENIRASRRYTAVAHARRVSKTRSIVATARFRESPLATGSRHSLACICDRVGHRELVNAETPAGLATPRDWCLNKE